MHSAFNMFDKDRNGTVGREEFLMAIGVDPTDFALDIFRVLDKDGAWTKERRAVSATGDFVWLAGCCWHANPWAAADGGPLRINCGPLVLRQPTGRWTFSSSSPRSCASAPPTTRSVVSHGGWCSSRAAG